MSLRNRILENPFHVLGLPPEASRVELERTARRLLAELSIGRKAALSYETPLGPRPRTEDLVRSAAAALQDPVSRLAHEVWAGVPLVEGAAATAADVPTLDLLGPGPDPAGG